MKKYTYIILFVPLFIILSCSASRQTVKSENPIPQTDNDKRAYEHYFNGALLDFEDDYERALIEYYQALLYDSTSSQIYKAIARNLMRLQKYESAAQYLEKSLKYNPRDEETLTYLGETYYNLKDYDKSIFYYEKLSIPTILPCRII